MLKKFILLSFILSGIVMNAQKIIASNDYKIAFIAPNDIEKYETEAVTVLGYEPKDERIAVDIEVFQLSEQPKDWKDFGKEESTKLALSLGLTDVRYGGTLPNIKDAYFSIAHDKYGDDDVLVFVIAAINYKAQLAYEITIYVYDDNISEAKAILNSFALID